MDEERDIKKTEGAIEGRRREKRVIESEKRVMKGGKRMTRARGCDEKYKGWREGTESKTVSS